MTRFVASPGRWLAAIALALLVPNSPAHAAWGPLDVPLCAACNQAWQEPGFATDGVGGLYGVAWTDLTLTPMRHLDANGDSAPGWPAADATLTTVPGINRQPALSADGAGGVYAAWIETQCSIHCDGHLTGGAIKLQRFTSNGTSPAGWPSNGFSPFAIPYGLTADAPQLAPDGAGGVIVSVIRSGSPSLGARLFVLQRVAADGVPLWGGGVPGPVWTASTTMMSASLAEDHSGGAWLAWEGKSSASARSSVKLVHAQADGSLVDTSGTPLEPWALGQALPKLLADGAGGVFAAWWDSTAGGTLDLRAQHFDASGTAAWGSGVTLAASVPANQVPSQKYHATASLALDGAGGLYVAWTDRRSGTGVAYVSHLSAGGAAVAPWPLVGAPLSTSANEQWIPALLGDGAGGFWAVWDDHYFACAIHRYADGSLSSGWPADGRPLCTDGGAGICSSADGWQPYMGLLPGRPGTAIAVWDEYREYPLPPQADFVRAYAQQLTDDSPVAARASLVSADGVDGVVRIVWQVVGPAHVEVERALASAPETWASLASLTPEAGGRVTLADPDVRPGERYGYRLLEGGATLDERWLTVPRPGLRLDGVRPNPASGNVTLAVSLAEGTAWVELLDVAGRRVYARTLFASRAGVQSLALDASATLPAGVYLVRLVQFGHVAQARVCLLR